jgi:predicted  nucleic acid-binding Zn-ribbon protein
MTVDADERARCFINHYRCPRCGERWSDRWTAQCNDQCPNCGLKDIEPYASDDA